MCDLKVYDGESRNIRLRELNGEGMLKQTLSKMRDLLDKKEAAVQVNKIITTELLTVNWENMQRARRGCSAGCLTAIFPFEVFPAPLFWLMSGNLKFSMKFFAAFGASSWGRSGHPQLRDASAAGRRALPQHEGREKGRRAAQVQLRPPAKRHLQQLGRAHSARNLRRMWVQQTDGGQ